MRRRELIIVVALGAAVLRPRLGAAQQRAGRRLVATLTIGSKASNAVLFEAFRQALAGLGYGDDQIAIESRWADGHADRLPALAAELVQLSPAVILAAQSTSASAVQKATTTIPIVFAVSDDPIGIGLVASLARPGGNVTGMSFVQVDTIGKQLQLLATMVPGVRRIAVLSNPSNPQTTLVVQAVRQAAGRVPTELVVMEATKPEELAAAFAAMEGAGAAAVLVLGDGLFTSERGRIITLAARYRLPALYHDRIIVEEGGLMSYGPDLADNYRGAAILVDKILKGAKPADLPVAQPTKLYLYINQKTAKTLGLSIPPMLEALADKVVE